MVNAITNATTTTSSSNSCNAYRPPNYHAKSDSISILMITMMTTVLGKLHWNDSSAE